MNTLKTPLARLAHEHGLSARQLADRTGIHPTSMYEFFAGRRKPRAANSHRIADALNVPVADLFPHLPATQLALELGRQGMTGLELARRTGLGRDPLRDLIAGQATPRRPTAYKIAAALDVRVDDLWPQLVTTPTAALLAELGMTAGQVAAEIGMSKSTVTKWQAGLAQPSPQSAAKLAAFARTIHHNHHNQATTRRPRTRRSGTDGLPVLPALPHRAWLEHAACANDAHDPDLWWPEDDDPGYEARRICGTCPVIDACRDAFIQAPLPDTSCIIAGVQASTLLQPNTEAA
jgi:transcriptional regulator with XRE-family HTH domain